MIGLGLSNLSFQDHLKLTDGQVVYLFRFKYSRSGKLSYYPTIYECRVVGSGRTARVNTLKLGYGGTPRISMLATEVATSGDTYLSLTREDAINLWNSQIYNAIDDIVSYSQTSVKRLKHYLQKI